MSPQISAYFSVLKGPAIWGSLDPTTEYSVYTVAESMMTVPTKSTPRKAFSPREVSETLGISLRTTYTWIRSGELPSTRIGGLIRIPQAALDRRLAGER